MIIVKGPFQGHRFLWRLRFKIANICEGCDFRPNFFLDEPLVIKLFVQTIIVFHITPFLDSGLMTWLRDPLKVMWLKCLASRQLCSAEIQHRVLYDPSKSIDFIFYKQSWDLRRGEEHYCSKSWKNFDFYQSQTLWQ